MFGNQSSKDSVRRAVTRIREYEKSQYELFKLFPPYIDLNNNLDPNHRKSLLDKEVRKNRQIEDHFNKGVITAILEYFFDGDEKYRDEFYKKTIIDSFNFGFLANDGKSYYKGFLDARQKPTLYIDAGETWAKNFYIPEIIEKGLNAEKHSDLMEYESAKYIRTEDGEYYAEMAGISIEDHHKWCNEQIDLIENIYIKNSRKEFQLHIRKLFESGRNFEEKKFLISDVEDYENECDYLNREMIPELVDDWNEYIYELINEEKELRDNQSIVKKRIKELESENLSRNQIIDTIENEFNIEVKKIREKWLIPN